MKICLTLCLTLILTPLMASELDIQSKISETIKSRPKSFFRDKNYKNFVPVKLSADGSPLIEVKEKSSMISSLYNAITSSDVAHPDQNIKRSKIEITITTTDNKKHSIDCTISDYPSCGFLRYNCSGDDIHFSEPSSTELGPYSFYSESLFTSNQLCKSIKNIDSARQTQKSIRLKQNPIATDSIEAQRTTTK